MSVKITRPQGEFIRSNKAFPALIAGLGSGKSQAATYRLANLMLAEKHLSVSHFFPSYRLAKRRGFDGIKKYLELLGIKYYVNKTDLTVYVPEVDGTFYLETYHDPDSIVSFEIAHAVIDELDTLPKEPARHVWTKINERVRQFCLHPAGNTIGCVSTPDHGTGGFCYELWGSGEHLERGYHYIKAGTRSNKFLPDGYADQIAKNYDPVMAEAYLEGSWVSFSRDKVYHFYEAISHDTDRIIESGDVLHIGLDFNVGGTCATVWIIDQDSPHCVDEFVSQNTQDFIIKLAKYRDHKIKIYPDASGKAKRTNASLSDISMITQAGFSVDTPNANPPVRDRVNSVNALLSHNRLKINRKKCPNVSEALSSQGYLANGEPEKFNSHPALDDWADSSGYFLHRKFPIAKPIIITGISSAF